MRCACHRNVHTSLKTSGVSGQLTMLAVFATVLGIGKTTVQQWEHGQKKPSGPAQRLLDLIDRKGLSALG
jgi:DNA-binding transcriptional regulator YiaG